MKKLLQKRGLGWVLNSGEEMPEVFPRDITPVPLLGHFDSGFALADYSRWQGGRRIRTSLGELVYRFKYEGNRYAGMVLADLASDFISKNNSLKSSDVMLTVPPSFKSRSLDPVTLLAKRIEERNRIPWERAAFRRTRLTKAQKDLRDSYGKKLNVCGAYRLTRPLNLKGKRILLLDDIYDSGATLNDISDLLRQSKPAEINVLVLARTQFSLGSGPSI